MLGRFGRRVREARRAYEAFVAAGVEPGHREEFSGGGLRRSLLLLGSAAGAHTRGVATCIAVHRQGTRGADVGRVLGLTNSGASRSVARGRSIPEKSPELLDHLLADPSKGGK